jgi:uncharacterized protein GlcG (DUF336 family)
MGDTRIGMRSLMIVSLAGASSLLGWSARADSLPTGKQLSLSLGMEAAMEAVTVCEKSGYHVTATVVDQSGLIKAVAKGDRAPPHTLDSSRGKAYAAVSLGPNFNESTTSAIVARVSNGAAFGPLQHLPGVFLVGRFLGSNRMLAGTEVVKCPCEMRAWSLSTKVLL